MVFDTPDRDDEAVAVAVEELWPESWAVVVACVPLKPAAVVVSEGEDALDDNDT